jgi:hypothetical protein
LSSEPFRSKDKLKTEDKEQLLIYQLASQSLDSLFQKPVNLLTYHYLENGEKLSFSAKPEELEKMREKLIERIKRIEERIKED